MKTVQKINFDLLMFSQCGNGNTIKQRFFKKKKTRHLRRVPAFWELLFCVTSSSPFPSSCTISFLLRRAVSHMTIGQTRQRPKTTSKIITSQACEKKRSANKMCSILVSTIRLFSSSWCLWCGSFKRQNAVFSSFSTTYSLMSTSPDCGRLRRFRHERNYCT